VVGDRRDVAGAATIVEHHDGLRARGEGAVEVVDGGVEGAGVDLAEDRAGASGRDGVGGGDEAEGRQDDLVALVESEQLRGQEQPGRRAVDEDEAVRFHAQMLGERRLERRGPRSVADPVAREHLGDGGQFLFAQGGLEHLDHDALRGETPTKRPRPFGPPSR
jgi:hypothetical protein